ncbi:MAG: ABC transporter permease, partial [Gemmatimonadetes bacterium]|nr:ABC transporter permease [Gemmatimonadota bacterium]
MGGDREGGGLVRVLLRLYPSDVRERWGDEMAAAYRDQLRDARARGAARALRLRMRTAMGMARGAVAAWRSERGPSGTGGAAWSVGGAAAPGSQRWTTGGGSGMREWGREIEQAVRRLRRAPAFSAVTVLTVAVGVGAFAAVGSVAESVLLDPMPYEEPEELVWVWRDYSWIGLPRGWLGGPDIVNLREQDEVFEAVAAARSERRNFHGAEGLEPREVRATVASANLFDVLGIEPVLGRGFRAGEDAPGAPVSAVLGHALWRSAFAGDPGVVGSTIYLDGSPVTVVGVLPEGFDFVVHSSLGEPQPADLYLPLQMDLADVNVYSGFTAGLARLRDGVGEARLEAGLHAAARPLDEAMGGRGLRLWATPLKEDLVADVRAPLLAVVAAAAFLLLTLAANLATLFLLRGAAREQDVAVRTAMGAGRLAVARTLLLEGLVLAAAGGVLGI